MCIWLSEILRLLHNKYRLVQRVFRITTFGGGHLDFVRVSISTTSLFIMQTNPCSSAIDSVPSKMIRPYGSLSHELFAFRSLFQQSPVVTSMRLVSNAVSASDNNPQKLPQLPVPKLNDTLTKYLKSVEPLLNTEEFNITKTLVSQFGAEGGIGYKLQGLLEKRAQQLDNWLTDWWVHTAYLDFRYPVTVHSNPGLVFPLQQFKDQNEQLKYAASAIHAALSYKQLVDSDSIPTEKMGKSPLDMSQYKKVFGTCRIPGLKRDRLSFNDSKHIIVFHRGHIFKMPMWGQDGVLLNEQQTIDQLKAIIAASQTPSAAPVGVLTSEHRDTWGKLYEELIKDKSNKSHLKLIEESLFVLCLDEAVGLSKATTKTAKQTLAAAQTIHGGGSKSNSCNKWFDKTLQLVVGADGVVGLTYEHAPAEGQPIAIMTDRIVNHIAENTPTPTAASSSVLKTEKLDFNLSSSLKDAINVAKSNIDKLVEDLELNCFTYDKYGKDFIKSNRLSPDSYLQMAMQYAFYRQHKVPAAHYESAATRLYIGGRTETIRSCSNESVAFAKCMLDGKASPKEKFKALETAIKAHKDYSLQAVQGFGVDRHLLGLKLIAIENGMDVPKLYSDTGFTKSSHMRVTSSQVASKCDAFMAYGPTAVDGYATCYNPRPKDMNFATSAIKSNPDTSCDKYRKSLEDSLQDMHDVLQMNAKSKL